MIRYALHCDEDHAFESWFQSAAAFDALAAGGHLSCPECGSSAVSKALMAPAVREGRAGPARPEAERNRALARLKAEIETKSEYVGPSFALEARAIHAGDAPERSIHGEARPEEARKLIEDGVPILPLPFVPTRKVN